MLLVRCAVWLRCGADYPPHYVKLDSIFPASPALARLARLARLGGSEAVGALGGGLIAAVAGIRTTMLIGAIPIAATAILLTWHHRGTATSLRTAELTCPLRSGKAD